MSRSIPGAMRSAIALLAVAVAVTLTTMSPVSAIPRAGSHLAATASSDRAGVNTTRVIARWYDRHHHLIVKKTYGPTSEGQLIKLPKKVRDYRGPSKTNHNSGGNPSNSGTVRIGVQHNHYSCCLNTLLWTFYVWTKWSWHRDSNICFLKTDCEVNVIDKGVEGDSHDQSWDYLGLFSRDNHYTTSCGPHCGYHHEEVGTFKGLGLGGPSVIHDVTQHPNITLDSHNNGTWEWWYNCC